MDGEQKTGKSAARPPTTQTLAPTASNREAFGFLAGWQCQKAFFELHAAKGRHDLLWNSCQDSVKVLAGMILDWHVQHGGSVTEEAFTRVQYVWQQCGPDGYRRSEEHRGAGLGKNRYSPFAPILISAWVQHAEELEIQAPSIVPYVFSADRQSQGDFGRVSRLLQETADDLCNMPECPDLVRLGTRASGMLFSCVNSQWVTAFPECVRVLKGHNLLPDLPEWEFAVTSFEDLWKAEGDVERIRERLEPAIASLPERICNHAKVIGLEQYKGFRWVDFCQCSPSTNNLSEHEAVEETADRGEEPDERYMWARQAELVRSTNQVVGEDTLDKGVLSRACSSRTIETNGSPGRASLVKVSSFLAWVVRHCDLTTEEGTQIRNAIIGEINSRKPGRN